MRLRSFYTNSNFRDTSNLQILIISYLSTVATIDLGFIQSPTVSFLRLHRNCTDTKTFTVQASILKQRFIEKGYDPAAVYLELQNVAKVNRSSLLIEKPPWGPNDLFRCSMLTSFSVQHVLPEQTRVIFRGAPSLQSKIAPILLTPQYVLLFIYNLVGYYPCKKCVNITHVGDTKPCNSPIECI